VEDFEAISSEV